MNEDVAAVAVALAASLEAAGLPFAIGGSLALGIAGVVRATVDVDVDVFVEPSDYDRLLDTLAAAGCVFDREKAHAQAVDGATIVASHGPWRVDVFVPTIPFYDDARRRVIVVPFLGRQVPFLDAESIAVFKLLFFRGKDIADLERLVAVSGDRLDRAWVRERIVDMMGDDDARVAEWDRIVREQG